MIEERRNNNNNNKQTRQSFRQREKKKDDDMINIHNLSLFHIVTLSVAPKMQIPLAAASGNCLS